MSEDGVKPTRLIGNVNRLIHEPARLVILTVLSAVKEADFIYLLKETNLSKGNLSSHLSKLEEARYITIKKTYRGKIPLTLCSLTDTGRQALDEYLRNMKDFMETL